MADTATLPADHQIGANMPPDPIEAVDPIVSLTLHVSDLRVEVGNWCDGEKIANADQAAVVERLIEDVKDAIAAAEDARDGEIKPLTAQVTALREKYYPLIGETKKITGSLIKMKTALLAVKTDWANRENARIAKEAADARAEAKRLADIAAAAAKEAVGDIDATERAEDLIHDAQDALRVVKQVENATVKGMRTIWVIKGFQPVTQADGKPLDGKAALLRHYLRTNPSALVEAALALARTDIRAGQRQIPGLIIDSEQVAV
jgi:hypothetical protein